ncbi:helix-turn-helix domain-containing protein [Flammeovirga kamogawensis]|uniref:Helix-turn-helix transcriptional regulator n=1 Tax=Flammeovirga kamogawensis TaxID=373891 RepID=A0ABX8H3J7_9BACT|nr:AraC family transcriptional regulator [Flammeovirga kamogawensis]MBB6460160.1 AraC-like DNA-binding protein [Flammeovirga kamogawensis]QWG09972.1 helix-turn-helix transcriptional regulator [Flammeovirga kamogawensis]TRX65480.1 helix-turn-helix transcriptional regulator [Flammeovirga kamogawensis]
MVKYQSKSAYPYNLYKDFSNEFNGTWQPPLLSVNNFFGTIKATAFEYKNSFCVSLIEARFDRTINVKLLESDENIITIRIGLKGDWSYDSLFSKGTNDGISIYNSVQEYTIMYPKNDTVKWFVISFPSNYFNEENNRYGLELNELFSSTQPLYYYQNLDSKIESLIMDCYNVIDNKAQAHCLFLSRAYEIIMLLNQQLVLKNEKTKSIHPDDLEKMSELKLKIINDLSTPPIMSELCKDVGMSPSKLNRVFREVYKTSINAMYNDYRLNELYNQIKHSSKSLSDLSDELGYTNQSYMSRKFKKKYGISPSLIRNN